MIHLKLISQTGLKFDEDFYELIIPTSDGQIAVLNDHMPLVTSIQAGVLLVRRSSKDPDSRLEMFATYGGVVEVKDNQLNILVDEADHADSIDQAQAELAYDKALELKKNAQDEISLNHAQELIDRSQIRLQVVNLRKHLTKK